MDFVELNRRGLIPGPNESQLAFEKRVADAESVSDAILSEGIAHTQALFGIAPDWAELSFDNRGLAPWHGAAAWIGSGKVKLQLRKGLRSKKRLLGLYPREELIAHELAHVGRAAFEEGRYEEFFAYRTSRSPLRRWLGPLLQRPWEAWLLLGALPLGLLWPVIPLLLFLWALWRLTYRHLKLRACVTRLEEFVGERAWEVAFRLTDREIEQFARMKAGAIAHYADHQRSARWQLIRACYFTHETHG